MNRVGAGELDKDRLLKDINSIEIGESKKYLNCLVLNEIWEQLRLSNCFPVAKKTRKTISTSDSAKILTFNRLLHPSSKVKTVEWFNKTHLDKILDLQKEDYNKSKIFRELSKIHEVKDGLESHFFEFSQKQAGKEIRVFYYDGSTSWFEGGQCNLGVPGLEKTRGFFPNVIGIMLVSDARGFPIAWEIVEGRKKDTTELREFVERIYKKFGIKEITYCFDRGVASEKNFEFLAAKKTKYISGIRDNQIAEVFDLDAFQNTRTKILEDFQKPTKNAENPRRIVGINGFLKLGKQIYFKDLGVSKSDLTVRHIVSFNLQIYKREQNSRKSRIEEALKSVAEMNANLSLAERDRDFNATERQLLEILGKWDVKKFFTYALTPFISPEKKQTFQIELKFDTEAIEKSAQTDGLLVYITNHVERDELKYFKLSASEIVQHYKAKYVIENSFRELKSFLELRPFFVWTNNHVKAHFDIAMVAYFINNHIYHRLSKIDVSVRDFYELLDEASDAVEIKAPDGATTIKSKRISPSLEKCLNTLDIPALSLPVPHKHLNQ
jgi:transposase